MIAGRYTLVREIGRGGMGAVWLGQDEVLGRAVAVKRIGHFPGNEASDLERAEREARLAASLNHPHVVSVFDLVEDDGEQWLVMEYVDGVTLSALAGDGLDPQQAAPYLRQAAEALAAAHAAGIVHRDVKPSNILVTPDGTAKLLDFGIARAEADSTLTQTGLVTGSPAYLAPEVVTGGTATTSSDVWSLGATLFHALEGRPPYDVSDNVVAALYRIVHEEPPRTPHAGHLAPLLEGTMCVDPADRWTMAQVRDFLDGVPVTAPHPRAAAPSPGAARPEATRVVTAAPGTVTPQPARRRATTTKVSKPFPVTTAAVGAIVVLMVTVVAFYLGNRGDQAPPATRDDPVPSRTDEPAEETAPTAEELEVFVEEYLALVPNDPEAAFVRLTPAFQDASDGLEGYLSFWGPVRSATVRSISADPESMTVSYTVDYDRPRGQGGDFTDDVTLQLVQEGDRLLIDGEPSA